MGFIYRNELKPGDHIYSWRTAYDLNIYAHHGIYVGEGKVIHFTVARGRGFGSSADRFMSSSSSSSPASYRCPLCGHHSGFGGVISTCIDCFLDGGDLYLFEYGVSRSYFLTKPLGWTCTLASSDSPEVVLHRAHYLLEHGFPDYRLLTNNCKDFAIYCKTGLIAISKDPTGLAETSVGLAIVAFGPYEADISLRRDAEKVPVEELLSWYLNRGKSYCQRYGLWD